MANAEPVAAQIRAALEREPRLNTHRSSLAISVPGNKVVLDGEVAEIAEKRIAVQVARQHANGYDIIDRLCVRPSERLGDGAIRDFVARHLFSDSVFQRIEINCRVAGDDDATSQRPDNPEGLINVAVANGVVTLSGRVGSLSHRRLTEVLAWWARGCRNVENGLAIEPPERDDDGEISDALELILNKDPLLHSDQLVIHVRDARVTLRGIVATEEEKRMVERNIWYVDGVRDVINEIDVYQAATGRESMPASRPHFE